MFQALASGIVGLLLLAGEVSAFEVQAIVVRVDAAQRQLIFTARQQQHTIRVPEEAKVLDAAGRELPDGLRAADLREGTRVMLSVERLGEKMTLRTVRLVGNVGSPEDRGVEAPPLQREWEPFPDGSLRDRTLIRIVCHVEDENWLAPRCEELHQLLMQQMIPHEFYFLSNVKSHNRARVLDTLGDSEFSFFSSRLAPVAGAFPTLRGTVLTQPLAGAGAANPACEGAKRRADDDAEDGQSIGVVLPQRRRSVIVDLLPSRPKYSQQQRNCYASAQPA